MAGVLAVLAVTVDGRWRPGIGDPTFLGWFTAFSYVAAAVLCRRAARRLRSDQPAARRLRVGWMALALLMLLLGINKQLDLQSWFTQVGKDLALEQGWYEQRAQLQKLFIVGAAAAAAISAAVAGLYLRRELRFLWLPLLGAAFVVAFVMVRASSFHHVDLFLQSGPGGVRMNWILELGGIYTVMFGAFRFGRRASRR